VVWIAYVSTTSQIASLLEKKVLSRLYQADIGSFNVSEPNLMCSSFGLYRDTNCLWKPEVLKQL